MNIANEDRSPGARPWLRVALLLTAAGWGANQFASLLGAYRNHLGLSDATVTGLFALYVVGLLPGLLGGGPLSDRRGRKSVVLIATAVGVLGTVALMVGVLSIPWLALGRFLSGVSTGVALGAGTAWVKELSHWPHERSAEPGAGARRSSLFLSTGFGLGGLVSAVVVQWAPHPMVNAYLPHLVLCAVGLVWAWRAPDTVPERAGAGSNAREAGGRDPRFRWLVLPVAVWVFLGVSLGFGVLPGLVAAELPGYETLYSGVVLFVALGCGALVQPFARRMARRDATRPAVLGLLFACSGLLLAVPAVLYVQPALVLGADVLLGAGYGLCVVFGLTEIGNLAAPAELVRLTSVFWVLAYLGFCAPYAFTLSTRVAEPTTVLLVVAVLAALTCLHVLFTGRRLEPGVAAPREPRTADRV